MKDNSRLFSPSVIIQISLMSNQITSSYPDNNDMHVGMIIHISDLFSC